MKDKLKPCPFCGSPYANKPILKSYYNRYTGRMYFAECTHCEAASAHSQSEVIKKWNKRYPDEQGIKK